MLVHEHSKGVQLRPALVALHKQNALGPFTKWGSNCAKKVSCVKTVIHIYATHSEMKSFSLVHHVNTAIESNLLVTCESQSQLLSHHVNGP